MIDPQELQEDEEIEVLTEWHEEPARARVVKTPPFTQTIKGNTIRFEDSVLVEYIDTEIAGIEDVREIIDAEDISR